MFSDVKATRRPTSNHRGEGDQAVTRGGEKAKLPRGQGRAVQVWTRRRGQGRGGRQSSWRGRDQAVTRGGEKAKLPSGQGRGSQVWTRRRVQGRGGRQSSWRGRDQAVTRGGEKAKLPSGQGRGSQVWTRRRVQGANNRIGWIPTYPREAPSSPFCQRQSSLFPSQWFTRKFTKGGLQKQSTKSSL